MIIQTFAFVALLQSFLVAGQYSVQPCFDSRCSNCSPSLYSVNAGYPAAGAYENFTLAGAPSTNSSGGYNVWWRVSRPDTNCDILIMEQYSTSNFTGNVGNVILSTSNGGCYNTPQMHSDQWFTQFCCGNGDCQGAGASTAAQAPSPRRHKKRHVGHRQSIRQAANNSAQPANGNSTTQTSTNSTQPTSTNNSTQPTATITPASTVTASSHAQTARPTSTQTTSSAPSVRDDNTWCNEKDLTDYVKCVNFSCTAATRVGDPYQKSGEQIQATQQLSCDSATSCPQTIGNAIAVGSTLTNERSFTHTTSEGISIGLEAGSEIEDVITGGLSISYEKSFSDAVEQSASVANSTTKSLSTQFTTSQTISQNPGTIGYLWVTPIYNCQVLSLNCDGQDLTIEQCSPDTLPDGNTVNGIVGFLTIGQ